MKKEEKREQARTHILDLVSSYYNDFHKTDVDYIKGSRIPYAARVYDSNEMINLVDSALEFWLTSGRFTVEFEKKFANYIGVKYCALVNSGSSANLLAFMTLTSPLLEKRRIKRGDEVITVAAGFPTTISPIIQYGAIPVFVDVTIPEYNIDVKQFSLALSPKTKAVMLAHTLGNPFDIKTVKDFCDKNNLWLIEDNCDALGSLYTLDGKTNLTGSFGDINTSSFYPPHHITMGEGGAVYTDNPLLSKIMFSMRDWGRDCVCASGQDNLCGNRFNRQDGDLPYGYDHKYVYSHFGYNLKATDMQAAIGVAQLDKVSNFVEQRRNNYNRLKIALLNVQDKLILPEPCPNSTPSWFGFLITCKDGVNRNKLVQNLERNGIQTRMLFAGNMVKQPCFCDEGILNDDYRVVGTLENTNLIMNNSFWVGVYPGLTDDMIDYMAEVIIKSVSQ
ncbi:MAG: lipopolysaccharide biosynthesis protein RfbH [Oscillospiraceae bacterium]|jgi:CDP-6-deoxy-D-xylo-4-hexulose-3-dehydrase|nr:lipopolysaccharide biosynthesis protein RfbH [Oscillospiraceae bacterium]